MGARAGSFPTSDGYAIPMQEDTAEKYNHDDLASRQVPFTDNERAVHHNLIVSVDPSDSMYEEPVPLSMQDRTYSSVNYAEVGNVGAASLGIDKYQYETPVSLSARSQVVQNDAVSGVHLQYDKLDSKHSVYGSEA